MLRYKGVLNMAGTDRKVIFQGVHQLMSSDLGQPWADNEERISRVVFIGIDLPEELFLSSLGRCVIRSTSRDSDQIVAPLANGDRQTEKMSIN